MKSLLTERLVRPALSRQWGVTAVHFVWPRDELNNQMAWEQIVEYREALDQVVCGLPDCLYFVSAIGGIHSSTGVHKGYPRVGYWIVTLTSTSDCRPLLQHLTANHVQAVPKLLLQPYQQAERDFNNVLFKLLKDNMHGCVPRLVQESWQRCYSSSNNENELEPAVKICMVDPSMEQDLMTTVSKLRDLRFLTKLIRAA